MSECKHKTNYYVEYDAPVLLNPDGSVKSVTYRCSKCNELIYREKPWEDFKVFD